MKEKTITIFSGFRMIEMKKKKWWRVLLPVLILVNIVVVVLILGSAKPDSSPILAGSKTEFKAVEIPKSVSFAGEPMPLKRFDVKESLDRELLSNAYFHSQTIRYIKLAPRYFSVIEPILKEKGIPDDFKYLAVAESGFNPRAVSSARAIGFWQFMKGTAQDYGLEVNSLVDERYHIEKSTYEACEYLLDSYEKFGSWTLVAASYNRGMTGVKKQMTRQKEEDYYDLLLTTETARYVFRIVALKLILENPEQYNFVISDKEKYPVIKTKEVEITGKVDNFADFALKHRISYKLLKDFNPWLRDNHLTNAKGKKYIVKIPVL
ncbi:MAG: lytic transglycosylase domain-containing protein [Draconibacterium sp.]|nr:lytic transglycosylase domain-containing protein [Draconibacterium sp.]